MQSTLFTELTSTEEANLSGGKSSFTLEAEFGSYQQQVVKAKTASDLTVGQVQESDGYLYLNYKKK